MTLSFLSTPYQHLIDYIGELHPFYVNVVKTLPFQDALGVTEAIAHVLAVIPVTGLTNALQSFCMPLAQDLHTIIAKGKDSVAKEERIRAGGKERLIPEREGDANATMMYYLDILEQISAFIDIIRPEIPAGQPHPCIDFVTELWPVFTLCLNNFGSEPTIAEPLCRCYKGCLQSYRIHFVPLLPQLMESVVSGFDQTGLGVYLWVGNKIIKEYAQEGSDGVAPCFGLLERLSLIVFGRLNGQKFDDFPDGKVCTTNGVCSLIPSLSYSHRRILPYGDSLLGMCSYPSCPKRSFIIHLPSRSCRSLFGTNKCSISSHPVLPPTAWYRPLRR